MANDDELKQLRDSWNDFVKWTASISIFFITISLTVLTFQKGKPDPSNIITLYITLFFSLTNILLTWLVLKLYLRVRQIMAEYNIRGHFKTDNEKTEFTNKTNRADPLQKWVTATFTLNFGAFIAFLISYIRC